MGKLQTGRFERLAARSYSIKGPGALVDLDETVLGVLLLERQAGMEAHLMQQWSTFGARVTLGAVGGQYSWAGLNNPVGSGRIVVLDRWIRDTTTVTGLYISRGVAPGFIAPRTGEALDTRLAVAFESGAGVIEDNTATASFGNHVAQLNASAPIEYPIVLGEDGTVLMRSSAVNEGMTISFYWAERELQPFESD